MSATGLARFARIGSSCAVGTLGLSVLATSTGSFAADTGSPWLADRALSPPGAMHPDVATNGRGDTAVVWVRHDGADDRVQVVVRPAGGPWSETRTLSVAGQNARQPDVSIDDAGDVTVVWERFNGSHTIVQTARKPAHRPWAAAAPLSALGADAAHPRVSAGPGGLTVAVWHRVREAFHTVDSTTVIQAAVRQQGESWRSPVNLSDAAKNADSPVVAVGGDGVATVAWRWRGDEAGDPHVVQTRYRRSDGSWSRTDSVSDPLADADGARLAADRAGNAALTWFAHDGLGYRPFALYRLARAGEWQDLASPPGTGNHLPQAQIAVADGTAVLAWRAHDGAAPGIHVTVHRPGKDWSAPSSLHQGDDAREPAAAVDGAGRPIVTFVRSATGEVLSARRLTAGGTWEPSRDLGRVAPAGWQVEPRVSAAGTGDAVAVWQHDTGEAAHVRTAALDAAPPTTRMTAPDARHTVSTDLPVSWLGSDAWSGVATYRVRVARARHDEALGAMRVWLSASTARTRSFTAGPGRTYCFEARATDRVGNVGAFSDRRCTTVPLDDRSLDGDGRWTRRSVATAFGGTLSVARTAGATLSVPVRARQIALVVTRCPGCGDARVYLGDTLLRTISTESATTQARRVVPVKTYRQPRAGVLRVVTSSAAPVRVDGLAVSYVG